MKQGNDYRALHGPGPCLTVYQNSPPEFDPNRIFFSLFLSSHYTAAVAAKACEGSGAEAGSVVVIFPSERRALSEDSAPLVQYAQCRSLNTKCPLVIC